MTFSRPSTPSISLSSCGHDRVLDVAGHARPAGAEDRVHLVEEDDDRHALAGLLPGPLEDQPDVPLGLADVLVEQLGALDVEEEALALRAPARPYLPPPSWPASSPPPWRSASCRSRAGRTAGRPWAAAAGARRTGRRAGRAARRRRGSARSGPQAADLGVVDVGHFLEDQLLDLGLGDALVHVAGPRLEQQRVTGAQRWSRRSGSASRTTRSSSACEMTSARSPPSRISLSMTTSPIVSKPCAMTTLSASLSMTSWPGRSVSSSMSGLTLDPHLAAAGEDVDGAVLVGAEEHAEAGGRLGEPVDLFLERDDLVPGLPQRVGEPLVLPGDGGEPGLGLAAAAPPPAGPASASRQACGAEPLPPPRGTRSAW